MTAELKASILIASDDAADVEIMHKSLADRFGVVNVATAPERAVAAFDQHRPDVLILAFDKIAKAEQYYLGVYRHSKVINDKPHRTILLCTKDEVRKAYDLCRHDYFDDYVLYWPVTFDQPRLAMAVCLAIRALALRRPGAPEQRRLASMAQQVADIEPVLDQLIAGGDKQLAEADAVLKALGARLGNTVKAFGRDLTARLSAMNAESAMIDEVEHRLRALREEHVEPQLKAASRVVAPVRQAIAEMGTAYRSPLASARELVSTLRSAGASILVVEDEETQRRAIRHILESARYTVSLATTGGEALRVAGRLEPDLILMDVMLPDVDGVEITRRLKASARLSTIPIVIMTGRSARAVVVDSLAAGATDFLVKPYTSKALRQKVEQHLGQRKPPGSARAA